MIRIDLPYGKPQLSPNLRMHWAKRAAITRQVRRDTCLLAKAAKVQPEPGRMVVQFHYRPARNGRRDSVNLLGDLKACVDGLIDAGLAVDDDTTHVSTPEPRIHMSAKGEPAALWLEIAWTASTPTTDPLGTPSPTATPGKAHQA